ncbi:Snf7-domain-containing protein [Umbelopsis sp. PMI_123]|nr:Snf7-domain-containing protein [Umbelopsis sp. PMI_123]
MATAKSNSLLAYLQAKYPEFDPKKGSSRLSSLYSDFSSLKETNAYGYEANISFWRSVILQANRDGKISCNGYTLAVSQDGLEIAFEYGKYGRPLGMHNVTEHMMENGDLVTVESVLEAGDLSSRPWSSYLLSVFIARPLRYAASFIKSPQQSGAYAVIPTLKLVTSKLCEEHQKKQAISITDHLMTFETFRKRYSKSLIPDSELTDADIWLILRYIEFSKGVAIAEINRGNGAQIMLKFANAATVAQNKRVEITETDKGILSIMETSESLKSQIDELEATMSRLTIDTKECLAKKQKPQALYKLKQRKRIETVLEKRLHYLDAMDTILFRIESSQNDAQIVQAYDLGANALKSVLSSSELNVDAIDMTMDKVQETFADQREIDDALQLSMAELQDKQYGDISNDELEKELEELEKAESKALERHRSASPFERDDISIPTHRPIMSALEPSEESSNPQKTKIPLENQ